MPSSRADELEALRRNGLVAQKSTRLRNSVSKHGFVLNDPEAEAARRKKLSSGLKQSRKEAQMALRAGGTSAAAMRDLNLLYKKLMTEQRQKKKEAEKNMREWRRSSYHRGTTRSESEGEDKDEEQPPEPPMEEEEEEEIKMNAEAVEMLPEHVVTALKAKYETDDAASALARALKDEEGTQEGEKGALAELMELPLSPTNDDEEEKDFDEEDTVRTEEEDKKEAEEQPSPAVVEEKKEPEEGEDKISTEETPEPEPAVVEEQVPTVEVEKEENVGESEEAKVEEDKAEEPAVEEKDEDGTEEITKEDAAVMAEEKEEPNADAKEEEGPEAKEDNEINEGVPKEEPVAEVKELEEELKEPVAEPVGEEPKETIAEEEKEVEEVREELEKLNIDEEPEVRNEEGEKPTGEIKEDPKEVEKAGPNEPSDLDLSSIDRVEQTKRFYDTHAQQYIDFESWVPVDDAAPISDSHIDIFLERLKKVQGDSSNNDAAGAMAANAMTIIDLGCGHGRDVLHFSSRGHHVLGVDNSIEMLRRARETAPDVHYLNMDVRSLEHVLVDLSVDGVWARASLWHLSRKDALDALVGLRHKVRDGGILYASFKTIDVDEDVAEAFNVDERFTAAAYDESRCDSRRKLCTYYTVEGARVLLAEAGWEISEAGEDRSTVFAFATRRGE